MTMKPKSTDNLNSELSSVSSLQQFLSENEECFQSSDSTAVIAEMIQKKKIPKSALAKKAGMSGVYLYQILSRQRTPSRDRLICLCIGLQATLDETQDLLKQSRQATLYPKEKRDAVIIYGIMNKLELFEINDLLFDAGEKTLI